MSSMGKLTSVSIGTVACRCEVLAKAGLDLATGRFSGSMFIMIEIEGLTRGEVDNFLPLGRNIRLVVELGFKRSRVS